MNNKFDKMMHSYCNRNVMQFEFKEKKLTVKRTALIAAALVVVILVSILAIPAPNKPIKESSDPIVEVKRDNSFFLSASAAEREEEAVSQNVVKYEEEYLYTKGFYINGQNIEKVRTYSKDGNIAIAYSASRYNVTDRYHYENFPHRDDIPDSLLVIPNKKDINGEYIEVYPNTDILRDSTYYSCVDIVDINKNDDYKHIVISCIPIDKDGNPLSLENFPQGFSDTLVVEVTYLDGEVQTRTATVTFGDGEIAFDLNPHF